MKRSQSLFEGGLPEKELCGVRIKDVDSYKGNFNQHRGILLYFLTKQWEEKAEKVWGEKHT